MQPVSANLTPSRSSTENDGFDVDKVFLKLFEIAGGLSNNRSKPEMDDAALKRESPKKTYSTPVLRKFPIPRAP